MDKEILILAVHSEWYTWLRDMLTAGTIDTQQAYIMIMSVWITINKI